MKINKSKILGSRKIKKKKARRLKLPFFLGLLLSFLYAWKLATFTVMFVQNRLFLFLPLSSLFFQSTGHVREHCVIAVTARLFCFSTYRSFSETSFSCLSNGGPSKQTIQDIIISLIISWTIALGKQNSRFFFSFSICVNKLKANVFLKICKNPARAKTQAFR